MRTRRTERVLLTRNGLLIASARYGTGSNWYLACALHLARGDRTDGSNIMRMSKVAVVAKLGLIALLAQGVAAAAAEVKVMAGVGSLRRTSPSI